MANKDQGQFSWLSHLKWKQHSASIFIVLHWRQSGEGHDADNALMENTLGTNRHLCLFIGLCNGMNWSVSSNALENNKIILSREFTDANPYDPFITVARDVGIQMLLASFSIRQKQYLQLVVWVPIEEALQGLRPFFSLLICQTSTTATSRSSLQCLL